MGLWRGKKGSSVFYQIKNSNSAQKQGIRERVYEQANPQTSKQAAQRMKMLPIQRFYQRLKGVIDRGFEGVKYGVLSKQQFLKYALSMTEGFPYISQYESSTPPGQFLISRGSLGEIRPEFDSEDNNTAYALYAPMATGAPIDTVADLTNALVGGGTWEEGDQITIVSVFSPVAPQQTVGLQALGPFRYTVKSIYLNASDTTAMSDILGPTTTVGAMGESSTDYKNTLMIGYPNDSQQYLVGIAIIQSRESDAGGHLRSTSYMAIDGRLLFNYTSELARRTAQASYEKKIQTSSTDWPVDGDEEQADPVEYVTVGRDFSGLTGLYAQLNGREYACRVNLATGDVVALYGVEGPVDLQGEPLYVTSGDEELEAAWEYIAENGGSWVNELPKLPFEG